MDLFKVFDSGHLYGLVRIVVIAALHKNHEKSIIETFAFSLYDEKIFKGTIYEYNFDISEMIDDEMKYR